MRIVFCFFSLFSRLSKESSLYLRVACCRPSVGARCPSLSPCPDRCLDPVSSYGVPVSSWAILCGPARLMLCYFATYPLCSVLEALFFGNFLWQGKVFFWHVRCQPLSSPPSQAKPPNLSRTGDACARAVAAGGCVFPLERHDRNVVIDVMIGLPCASYMRCCYPSARVCCHSHVHTRILLCLVFLFFCITWCTNDVKRIRNFAGVYDYLVLAAPKCFGERWDCLPEHPRLLLLGGSVAKREVGISAF